MNGVYDNHNDKQNDSQNDKLSDSVRKTYHRGQAPVIGLISLSLGPGPSDRLYRPMQKNASAFFLPIAAYRPPQPYKY